MYIAEDYADSYGSEYYEGFSHGWDECDYANEFGYSDENHYDPFLEGYRLGYKESGEGNAEPNEPPALVIKGLDDIIKSVTEMSVPLEHKAVLTISEAAEYSNIGQNKIEKLLKTPNCPFVLFVGSKKLVKRKEFEQFISSTLEV